MKSEYNQSADPIIEDQIVEDQIVEDRIKEFTPDEWILKLSRKPTKSPEKASAKRRRKIQKRKRKNALKYIIMKIRKIAKQSNERIFQM